MPKAREYSLELSPRTLNIDIGLEAAVLEMFQGGIELFKGKDFSFLVNCCLQYTAWAHSQGHGPALGEWNQAWLWLKRRRNLKRGFFPKNLKASHASPVASKPKKQQPKKPAGLAAKPAWWGEQFRSYWDSLSGAADFIGDYIEEYGSEEAKEFVRNMAIQAIDFAAKLSEPRSVEPKALTSCPAPSQPNLTPHVVKS